MSGRESERLPESWHAEIPEDQWADALIAAVRLDVGALSAARAIHTIRGWRAARTSPDATTREAALHRLAMLAEALTSDTPMRPLPTERLDTIALLAPRPQLPPSNPERVTDSAVPVVQPALAFPDPTPPPGAPELTAWAYGQPGWAPEDDSGDDIDPLLSDLVGQAAVPRAPSMQLSALDLLDLDDDDTAHIAGGAPLPPRSTSRSRAETPGHPRTPDAHPRTPDAPRTLDAHPRTPDAPRTLDAHPRTPDAGPRRTSAAEAPPRSTETSPRRTSAAETPPRRTSAAETIGAPVAPISRSEPPSLRIAAPIAMPPLTLPPPPPIDEFADEPPTTAVPILPLRGPPAPQRPLPPPLPPSSSMGPPPGPPRSTTAERRPAGRPGVVRRATAQVAPPEPPRPRAALVQVRALYAAILPLCRELVPLSPERRSRRFWTHWREASGDRGVRREVAEQILETARDVRGLASELIAEVQTVDAESVRTLIDRLDAEADQTEGSSVPRTTEQGARGPLVGAVVRVENLPFEDE